ncbi:hypothetical protein L484_008969 [Morus notabilis]|uniref:Uncharacterized protein n=1 Tax=Morus notabilis TaxID=981085 RepID=W9SIT9_9ROSA|nr:hypothetical protein L484_008969 [Morus notabilis]
MLYLLSLILLPHLSRLLVTRYLRKGDIAKSVRSQTRRSSSKIAALIPCRYHLYLRDRGTASRSSPLQNFYSADVLLVQKCLPFGADGDIVAPSSVLSWIVSPCLRWSSLTTCLAVERINSPFLPMIERTPGPESCIKCRPNRRATLKTLEASNPYRRLIAQWLALETLTDAGVRDNLSFWVENGKINCHIMNQNLAMAIDTWDGDQRQNRR